jgi:hypothetical protein
VIGRGGKAGDPTYYGTYNITASNTEGEFWFLMELGKNGEIYNYNCGCVDKLIAYHN